MIFVFGSNEAGIHGAGAAKTALNNYGAVWGQGVGLFGNSYALPTKDTDIETLCIGAIRTYVNYFLAFASVNPNLKFQVTRIGCGLAGFTDSEIAPLFQNAPSNCFFDSAWKTFLSNVQFWGTF